MLYKRNLFLFVRTFTFFSSVSYFLGFHHHHHNHRHDHWDQQRQWTTIFLILWLTVWLTQQWIPQRWQPPRAPLYNDNDDHHPQYVQNYSTHNRNDDDPYHHHHNLFNYKLRFFTGDFSALITLLTPFQFRFGDNTFFEINFIAFDRHKAQNCLVD